MDKITMKIRRDLAAWLNSRKRYPRETYDEVLEQIKREIEKKKE